MREVTNIMDVFLNRVEKSGYRIALRSKIDNQWKGMTWKEFADFSRSLSEGLLSLGLKKGDKVAIISSTRKEWMLADVGIMGAGAIVVPIYQSNISKECDYIINNSESKFVFAENQEQLDKLIEAKDNLKKVSKVILFDGESEDDWVISIAELIELGKQFNEKKPDQYEKTIDKITENDLLTIIYTSGTTGPPKGVMLTHKNGITETGMIDKLQLMDENDEQLMFLPLAHSFARLIAHSSFSCGYITAFAESIEKVVDNLGEVKPTFMVSVPRIFEKVYTKVKSGAEQSGGLKKSIFNWSMKVGYEVSNNKQGNKSNNPITDFKFKIANKLVFSKLKQKFGGRIRFFVSGGAPLAKEIAEFFHAADLLILEGYGLTENFAAATVNRPHNFKFGSVGRPLPGEDVKIAEDGEILIKGENVMKGYYANEGATSEVMNDEGWFMTGDIGTIDKDGFVFITDRKKDLIVTAGGKNVAPQNIENIVKTSQFISQVMVYGDKRKYLSALITLDEENMAEFAKTNNISYDNIKELSQHPRVYDLIQQEIDNKNSEFASYETIKKFKILEQDLSIEDGDLTPTLKVKRKIVTKKYWDLLDSMYEN